MQEFIERQVDLRGVSAFIGTSHWARAEDWVCPQSTYVVCQRLSEGHPPLQLGPGPSGLREVYPRVRALGFMPSSSCITLQPLGQPLRTLNCWFDLDYFESATELDTRHWRELAGAFMPMTNRSLDAMMQRIHLELAQPGFGSEQVIEAACTMIAVEMARTGRQSRTTRGTMARQTGLAPWQLRRVRERLQASPETGYPQAQELAELCGISRNHLMRMFKMSTGWTLHRYVTEERLLAARRLLAEDKMSIKEIGAALGFSSAGHFTNAFLRHEHVTPSEFRRRLRSSRTSVQ